MDERPQPGDTIVILSKTDRDFGREFFVIECPIKDKGGPLDKECLVWVDHLCYFLAWYTDDVKLVKKARTTEGAQNCGSVEASLTRQRDDNLRDVFS